MEWYIVGALLVLLLVGLCLGGVPIAFALILTGIIPILMLKGFIVSVNLVGFIAWQTWYSYALIAVPLFILMSEVIGFSGIAKDLFDTAEAWIGTIPGGLAVASIVACAAFGAVCGSSMIGALTIGSVAVPEMLRRRYDKSLATGSVAAGGTLNVLIPPSLIMIFYGIVTEQSIGHLFLAGVIPGVILATLFSIYVVVKVKLNPDLAPPVPTKYSWRARMRSLSGVWPVAVLGFLVMGSLYTGAATPSESAGIGASGAIVIAAIYRKLSWPNFRGALLKTAQLMGFLGLLIMGANILGWVLGYYQIPQQLAALIASIPVGRWVILGFIVILYFFLGMILETAAMTFITLPVVFPVVFNMGFDPIWFGVVYTILCEMCAITPPVGLNLYVVQSVVSEQVTVGQVIRGVLPFIVLLFLLIVIVCIFPQLAIWLPGKMN